MKSSTKRAKTYGLTLPKIRFQADADLNNDQQVLKLAADQGRILVTHDRRTMPRHFADFITRETSPGMLIVSQKASVALVIEELIMIWGASEADDYTNRYCTIPL